MPARLTCPYCETNFRPPGSVPPGQAVRCPDCDRKFHPDDDPPRRSRRDRADDRPRGRPAAGRKRAKKVNPLVFILPAAGLAFLLVAGLVVYLTVIRDGGPGGGPGGAGKAKSDNELLAQLPDDVYYLTYVELDAVYNHPKLPARTREAFDRTRGFKGLPAGEVGAFAHAHASDGHVLVVKPKAQPADRDRIVAQTQGRRVTYLGRDAYQTDRFIMEFPNAALVTFIPDRTNEMKMGIPQGPRVPRFDNSAFPELYRQVKGPIWTGGGGGVNSGQYGSGAAMKQWRVTVRYAYTRLTLGPDTVESVTETELADAQDAIAFAEAQEYMRSAPDQADTQVTRSGTRVTVRKVQPIERASDLLGRALPPGF